MQTHAGGRLKLARRRVAELGARPLPVPDSRGIAWGLAVNAWCRAASRLPKKTTLCQLVEGLGQRQGRNLRQPRIQAASTAVHTTLLHCGLCLLTSTRSASHRHTPALKVSPGHVQALQLTKAFKTAPSRTAAALATSPDSALNSTRLPTTSWITGCAQAKTHQIVNVSGLYLVFSRSWFSHTSGSSSRSM